MTAATVWGPGRRLSRPLVVAGAVALCAAAVLIARPATAHAQVQCDPGLSACVALEQAEQAQSTAQQQLQQIEASQESAQDQASQIATVVQQAQAAVQAEEDAIAQTQGQIDTTQRNERYTQASIDRDQAILEVRQQVVDEQVRNDAETDQTSYLQVLLTAQDFTEFVNRAMLVDKLIEANQSLVDQVQAERTVVQGQEAKLQQQEQQEQTLLSQQVQQEVVLQGQLATQQAALAQQQALVQQIAAQGSTQQAYLASLSSMISNDNSLYSQQVAAANAAKSAAAASYSSSVSSSVSTLSGGSNYLSANDGSNAYPAGQCTYYAASVYNIPSNWGNADTWFGSAENAGYATSGTPVAGAVVVWGSGGGYSEYGHVAVVTSVSSSTSFTVNEMNYVGEGIVDSRHVTSLSDVEGFIL